MTATSNLIEAPVLHPEADPFLAFVSDDVTRETLDLLAKQQCSGKAVFSGGVASAIEALGSRPTPGLLIIDLTDSQQPLADVHNLAEVCDVSTTVIAIGVANDVQLFRALLDAGVSDYLVKPVTFEAFEQAIQSVSSTKTKTEENSPGRLITIVGARGGVGASTLAINSAWLIAKEQKRRVALVDVDLQFGTVSLSLDVEPSRGFREALENPERVDELFVASVLVHEDDNLYVLGAEEALDEALAFDPQGLHRMLVELRRNFDCVILDLPRGLALRYYETLEKSAVIAVVTDFSLVGMRDSARLRSLIRGVAPRAKISVLANYTRPEDGSDVPRGAFEEAIGMPIDEIVPYDRKAMAMANRSGKPAPSTMAGSAMAKACRKISHILSGEKAVRKASPLIKLFKQ